ncbi:hypothetical protein Acr_06g0004340 [Actinidia rufa]|uniref:Uncharacterized protein n=1 Tax=Actinidia rufa TaxID=165716 RepID=A0A7J0EPU1_9ERIC|nr:hypothetical protein Acr_06g0004340 [Actinidia rufa]
MLPTVPSERFALISVPSLSVATNLPIVILVFLSLVTIRISYIMITANDLITLERLLGIFMAVLFEDEVVVQALQRVFKFLAGLQDEYDQVWHHILNIDPIPSLTLLQNEESRRGVMLPTVPSERFALISVPSLSVTTNLPIVILVFLSLVTIRISYIMITASDLITLERLLGIFMAILFEDEVVVQALQVAVVVVLVLIIL